MSHTVQPPAHCVSVLKCSTVSLGCVRGGRVCRAQACSSPTTTLGFEFSIFNFWLCALWPLLITDSRTPSSGVGQGQSKNHYTTSLNQSGIRLGILNKKRVQLSSKKTPSHNQQTKGRWGWAESRKRGSLLNSFQLSSPRFPFARFARLVGGKNKTQCG